MIPCQSPLQKPAAFAPRSLYLEFHPATEREFGMQGWEYIKGTPSRATAWHGCENRFGVRNGVAGAPRRGMGLLPVSFSSRADRIVAVKRSAKVDYDSACMASVTDAYAGRSLSKPATSITALACCVALRARTFARGLSDGQRVAPARRCRRNRETSRRSYQEPTRARTPDAWSEENR
jgi:hypothetical protein